MPQLTILAVCDRVIIDTVGIASLINIFQRLEIEAVSSSYPADAISPMRWSVFTQWHYDVTDPKKDYVQRVEVKKPNGNVFIQIDTPLQVGENAYSRHHVQIMGLPLGHEGIFTVCALLLDVPDAYGEYYVELRYTKEVSESIKTNKA